MFCVRLSLVIALVYYCSLLVLIASIVLIWKSLWIKASAKWLNVMKNHDVNVCNIFIRLVLDNNGVIFCGDINNQVEICYIVYYIFLCVQTVLWSSRTCRRDSVLITKQPWFCSWTGFTASRTRTSSCTCWKWAFFLTSEPPPHWTRWVTWHLSARVCVIMPIFDLSPRPPCDLWPPGGSERHRHGAGSEPVPVHGGAAAAH